MGSYACVKIISNFNDRLQKIQEVPKTRANTLTGDVVCLIPVRMFKFSREQGLGRRIWGTRNRAPGVPYGPVVGGDAVRRRWRPVTQNSMPSYMSVMLTYRARVDCDRSADVGDPTGGEWLPGWHHEGVQPRIGRWM